MGRVQYNGRSSVMTGQILGMTYQIVIHILCPVIYFSHIHDSLLQYIITSVIIDEFFSRFNYFLTIEKYFFALKLYYLFIFSYCNVYLLP